MNETPTDIAIRVVQALLGDREPTKVSVRVTRGGTCEVEAEAGEGRATRHQFDTGRRK
jgi:hypothetical protein